MLSPKNYNCKKNQRWDLEPTMVLRTSGTTEHLLSRINFGTEDKNYQERTVLLRFKGTNRTSDKNK